MPGNLVRGQARACGDDPRAQGRRKEACNGEQERHDRKGRLGKVVLGSRESERWMIIQYYHGVALHGEGGADESASVDRNKRGNGRGWFALWDTNGVLSEVTKLPSRGFVMAYAAQAIRPSGVSLRSSSSCGKGELEYGAFPWSLPGGGRFISWPPRYGHLSWKGSSLLASTSAGFGCENLGLSSKKARRKPRGYFVGCACLYYVAHSQVPETESRKVPKEGVKKGRKSRIQNVEDSEIETPSSNGFSHAETVGDGSNSEQPVARKRTRKKKQDTVSSESGQTVGSITTTSRRGGEKKVESFETLQDRESFSDGSESDIETSLASDDDENLLETDDEPVVEAAARLTSRSGNALVANGETRQVLDEVTRETIGVGDEGDLRLMLLESIMERARSGDVEGVEEALLEMDIAGIQAGPRAYHGLIVAYARAHDAEGAMQALRREFASVERPLPETFVAMARMFGALGQAYRGEEILAVMEKLKHDPRVAWMILIEELQKAGHLQEATEIYFKGADGGIRAVPSLYNILIEENAKVGDHGNAINVMRSLQYAGFQPTTFHHNCLLMCQANANVPEVAAGTFESMQYGPDEMKPDTESYNWVLQAHIRHNHGDRCQEVVDLVGEMVEDHKRVQPNMRTYALLIECFTKYNVPNEAVRHFRALSKIPGGMQYLHNDGKNGDPLSLYLRSLCLQGRATDLLEALEAMVRDKQEIPPRAMFINQKGRTLVSSWIEPIGAEADLGYEVDYIARYVAEGGSEGTRKRWSDLGGRTEDSIGFAFSAPVEISFKQHCVQIRRRYFFKLIRKLRAEGVLALGPGATEEDVVRVMAKLRKETAGESIFTPKKPKAASKMVVSELKEELGAQGLPIDGTRPVLYQRVQKARRINRARGRPLWIPETEEESEEVSQDPSIDIFMERLNLKNDNTEFWRKRVTGEDQETELFQVIDKPVSTELTEDVDSDYGEEDEDDTEDEVEEEMDETEDLAEDGGVEDEDSDTPELLALKLLNKKAEASPDEKVLVDQDVEEGQWLGLTLQQKIAKLRKEKLLDPEEMFTIADVWGWTWENETRAKEPDQWTQEREVQLGMQIMQRVLDLNGAPTIGDCAMLVHAAMRIPWPEAIVSLIQQMHKLDFKFGSKLYNDVVKLFITVGEKDAAIAIIADMEEVGISAPGDLINTVLLESALVGDTQEIS